MRMWRSMCMMMVEMIMCMPHFHWLQRNYTILHDIFHRRAGFDLILLFFIVFNGFYALAVVWIYYFHPLGR